MKGFKQVTTIFIIINFIIFNLSCTVTKVVKKTPSEIKKGQKSIIRVKARKTISGKKIEYSEKLPIIVKAVQKISGEKIQFSKEFPGKIINDRVVGAIVYTSIRRLKNYQIKKTVGKNGVIEQIITKAGTTINCAFAMENRMRGIFYIPQGEKITHISIPFEEIELIWVEETKVDPGRTILLVLGIPIGVIGLLALLKESCPFIYSFNGTDFVLDAEPYGGATCQGLKRTEWCSLDYLREVNGWYKILVVNEVDETQYTDEIKLLVVDHPEEIKVVPDEHGKIHTILKPIIPIRAFNKNGRNLMSYVSENDWKFWQTRIKDKNPDRKEDLRDELIFEFPKPDGASKAKLLFNGCNTLWASQMVKRFLELYGDKVYDYYDEVNNFGPAYFMLKQWNLDEELYRLQIRVETEDGWRSKGTIVGGGPFVSEDRVYTIDLDDVPGDTLKIKLTPPATFWMINYLAVDYTEDIPVTVTEIEAVKAVDHKGRDVQKILNKNDNDYLIMPYIGDKAELLFEAPAKNDEMTRSIILKASGYYDIHLEAKGEPQSEILMKFLQPNYTIQYAFKEYLKWKKENTKSIEH